MGMVNCSKCGKQCGLDNPQRAMNLCEKCYREVFDNAPELSNNLDTHSGMIFASRILSDSSLLTDLKTNM